MPLGRRRTTSPPEGAVGSDARAGDLAGPGIRADRDALFADRTLSGRAFCHAYSDRADAWLTTLFEPRAESVALVAVGGYGRGELAPGSDLDVLLVHSGRRDVKPVAERIWYPIWDAGIKLGHG